MKRKNEHIYFGVAGLVTIIFLLATIAQVNAETYTIQVDSIYEQTEEDFYTLLYATCQDSGNTTHGANITFTINSAEFTYNEDTGRYEAITSQGTPGTEIYGTLDSFTDSENATSTATVTQNVTVTWTQGTLDRLQVDFMTGDWINAILGEYIYSMGAMYFWTAMMTILSVGVYNVSGVYATLFAWILGWGVFSGVVHGQAQVFGVLFIVLGAGLALVRLVLDRRTT